MKDWLDWLRRILNKDLSIALTFFSFRGLCSTVDVTAWNNTLFTGNSLWHCYIPLLSQWLTWELWEELDIMGAGYAFFLFVCPCFMCVCLLYFSRTQLKMHFLDAGSFSNCWTWFKFCFSALIILKLTLSSRLAYVLFFSRFLWRCRGLPLLSMMCQRLPSWHWSRWTQSCWGDETLR